MAASVRGLRIGGEGRVAEIDGAYFGGHVRPENLAADRVDRRLSENKSGKRRAVVVMREDKHVDEASVKAWIGERIAKWMIPDRVVFVDAIPRTGVGKFLKRELRDRYCDLLRT